MLPCTRPADLVFPGDLLPELGGGALRGDPPGGQDDDPAGELAGLVQVVGGHQDRGARLPADAGEQVVELPARLRVKARRRLVEEQQLRAPGHGNGQVQAPPLAAGQPQDRGAGLADQADRSEQVTGGPGSWFLPAGIGTVVGGLVVQELPDPPPAVVPPGLQHDASPGPPAAVGGERAGAEDADLAC